MANFDFFKDTTQKQAEMAEKMLYEKYGEEFVVESLGGRWGTATDGYYTCNCYPKNNENLKFQATIDKDYDSIDDEYATKIGEINAANYIYEYCLKEIDETACVLVQSGNTSIESHNPDLSVEEFLNNNKGYYVVYILVDENTNVEAILKNISKTPFYTSNAEMHLAIVFASDETKNKFNEWNQFNTELDDELLSILENLNEKNYVISNSSIIESE